MKDYNAHSRKTKDSDGLRMVWVASVGYKRRRLSRVVRTRMAEEGTIRQSLMLYLQVGKDWYEGQ